MIFHGILQYTILCGCRERVPRGRGGREEQDGGRGARWRQGGRERGEHCDGEGRETRETDGRTDRKEGGREREEGGRIGVQRSQRSDLVHRCEAKRGHV